MRPAIVPGIPEVFAKVNSTQFTPRFLSPAIVPGIPEVFAKVNSTQFTPRFLSSEWDLIHVYKECCRTVRLRRESVLG